MGNKYKFSRTTWQRDATKNENVQTFDFTTF